MGFLRRAVERRSMDTPGGDAGVWMPGMVWSPSDSGSHRSMQMSAVYACIRLLTEAVATLPVDVFIRRDGTRFPYRPRPRYLDFPEPGPTKVTYLTQVMMSLLTSGDAFVLTPRNEQGDVQGLVVLQPDQVTVTEQGNGARLYQVAGQTLTNIDLMQISAMAKPGDLRGMSPLRAAREVVDATIKAQDYGRQFFANSGVPPAVIQVPAHAGDDDERTRARAKRIADTWRETHAGTGNAGKVGVLLGGAEIKTLAVNPEDSQWLESRRFSVQEIARFFGVPPHLIADSSNSTSWGSGLAEQNLAFGQFSLRPWIERIEDAHNRLLSSDNLPDVFLKLNLDALLRASLSDRYASYAQGVNNGFLTINEARRLEDLPPVPEEIDQQKVEAVGALIRAGFDPASSLQALGLPPITHTGAAPVTVQNRAEVVNSPPSGGRNSEA